jgi:hypothetical protein
MEDEGGTGCGQRSKTRMNIIEMYGNVIMKPLTLFN